MTLKPVLAVTQGHGDLEMIDRSSKTRVWAIFRQKLHATRVDLLV